jgi:hypothetical protein
MLYITYRREDRTEQVARTIADSYMKAHSLKGAIVSPANGNDLIRTGTDVSACSVLVWIVGNYTLSLVDEQGRQVLGRVDDYQYTELKAAVVERIPVVALLLGEHARLTSLDLPPALRALAAVPCVRWDGSAQAWDELLEAIRRAEESRAVERLRQDYQQEPTAPQNASLFRGIARLVSRARRTSTWAERAAVAVTALIVVALLFRGCV